MTECLTGDVSSTSGNIQELPTRQQTGLPEEVASPSAIATKSHQAVHPIITIRDPPKHIPYIGYTLIAY